MSILQEIAHLKFSQMKKIASLSALLLPAISWAHPGHGETEGYTIIHYFTEPQHAVITISAVAVALIYIARERKRKQSQ
jgi:hypothetical protein